MIVNDLIFMTAIIVSVVGTFTLIAVLAVVSSDDPFDEPVIRVEAYGEPRTGTVRIMDPPPYDWSRHEGL